MKQRRVGTLTLGLTLILIGVIIPLSLIFKEKALTMLQFAPIVLIALGIEVLYYAFKYKEEKFKYDGLSIFMVIMITFVTITTSIVVPIAHNANQYYLIENEVTQEAQDKIEDILVKHNLNGNVNIYYHGNYYSNEFFTIIDETKIDKKNIRVNCQIEIENSDDDLDATKAELIVYNIGNEIAKQNIVINRVDLTLNGKKDTYNISLRESQLKVLTLDYLKGKLTTDED